MTLLTFLRQVKSKWFLYQGKWYRDYLLERRELSKKRRFAEIPPEINQDIGLVEGVKVKRKKIKL